MRMIVLVAVACLSGCVSSIPADDLERGDHYQIPEFGGVNICTESHESIVRVTFNEEVEDIIVRRALDEPGNGFDVYSDKAVRFTRLGETTYEARVDHAQRIGSALYLLYQFKRPGEAWPREVLLAITHSSLRYAIFH